jgi:hypothetical protein
MDARLLMKIRNRFSYFYNDGKIYVYNKRTADNNVYKNNDAFALYNMLKVVSKQHCKVYYDKWVRRKSSW